MIGRTANDILTSSGRHADRLDWVAPAHERNAHDLAPRVTALLMEFGESRRCNSGFRDVRSNAKARGAPMSNHLFAQADDIEDRAGTLGEWALSHEDALERHGLWAEHPHDTKVWLHVQSVPYQGWAPGMSRFFRWSGMAKR